MATNLSRALVSVATLIVACQMYIPPEERILPGDPNAHLPGTKSAPCPGTPDVRYCGRGTSTDIALTKASHELPCSLDELRVVEQLPRKFSNSSTIRFIIEGCNQRLTYLEKCTFREAAGTEGWPSPTDYIDGVCTYVEVGRVPMVREPQKEKVEP